MKRILIVESNEATGRALRNLLRSAGFLALGPAPTPFYAARLLGERHIDAAVMATRVHGQSVLDFAAELTKRGCPILFLKDEHENKIPAQFSGSVVFDKSAAPELVLEAVRGLLAQAPAEVALAPSPLAKASKPIDPQARMVRSICRLMREDVRAIASTYLPPGTP